MITIPLYIFLFLYFAYLALFGLFIFVNILHLFQAGALTLFTLTMTVILFAATVLIIFSTWTLLSGADWRAPLTVWNSDWIKGITGLTTSVSY